MLPPPHPAAPQNGVDIDEEITISDAIHQIRSIDLSNFAPEGTWNDRFRSARRAIGILDTTSIFTQRGRHEEQIETVTLIQNLAYHEADAGGIQDLAQWCVRQWLRILQLHPSSVGALTGLGRAWLYRAQGTLARIHRLEGSSSSGTSSGRPPSSGERMSYTSSDDAREAERATAEADTRAHTADYVEARGMLLPATEYFTAAVTAAEAGGETDGGLLSVTAEAFMSLGNVSYSHHNEQLFQRAIVYLRRASQIPNFTLSPYLQNYLDEYGRLVDR